MVFAAVRMLSRDLLRNTRTRSTETASSTTPTPRPLASWTASVTSATIKSAAIGRHCEKGAGGETLQPNIDARDKRLRLRPESVVAKSAHVRVARSCRVL
eukprot:Amastigsp_a856555_3.p3 type:complete len:100 gc:universal Amastigsp_a856555_3:453-154(-)